MRPRSDEPNRLSGTQQERTRVFNAKSQRPALAPKTRIRPTCLKTSGNKWRRPIKEVHSEATGGGRECPKNYKTIYNQNRHEKKHHPMPHLAPRVDHRSMSMGCELGATRAERQTTAYKPGHDSGEERAHR